MSEAELYVAAVMGVVAIVIAAFLLRSSQSEQATKSFGGGPLALTRRAVALWVIGLGICVAAFAISKLL